MLKYIVLLVVLFILSVEGIVGRSERREGWLSAYDQEPTDLTLEYRLSTGDISRGFGVYIAVPECNRIGETGIIELPNGQKETYQVFDCASRDLLNDSSYSWMKDNNIIAELDYYSYQEHGLGRATLYITNKRIDKR